MAKKLFAMTSPLASLNKFMEAELEKQRLEMLQVLDIAGEIAVKNQTLAHKYLNQTGNLSSSIGYLVLEDGKIASRGGFETTKDGASGAQQGEEFINSLIGSNRRGLALIVVAGMDYAVYVENMALDVLTTAELIAEKTVKQLLKAIG